jgi:hypothetical protein
MSAYDELTPFEKTALDLLDDILYCMARVANLPSDHIRLRSSSRSRVERLAEETMPSQETHLCPI